MQDPFLLTLTKHAALSAAAVAALLATSSDAFFHVDVRARTIVWSRGIRLLFGHDPQVVGERLDDWQHLAHPEELPRLIATGREVVAAGGSAWSSEFRFARADGTYAPVRARAMILRESEAPVEVIGSLADLSAVRTAEDELSLVTSQLSEELTREREERVLAEHLVQQLSAGAPRIEGMNGPTLTARQREVLSLIRFGYTNKEIAGRLRVTEQTAKVQVSKLLKKFKVRTRAALAVIAREDELSR